MSENISLPVIETVKMAWSKVEGAKRTLWAVFGLIVLVSVILASLGGFIKPMGWEIVAEMLHVIALLLQLVFAWGLIYIGIQRALDRPIQWRMVRYVFDMSMFLKLFGCYILQILIMLPFVICFFLLGLIPHASTASEGGSLIAPIVCLLLFVVGSLAMLFIMVRISMAKGVVLERKENPWQAIKTSFKATRGNVWRLLGIYCINFLILLISIIPLGIGLIWSLPYGFISYGVVYKQLVGSRLDI